MRAHAEVRSAKALSTRRDKLPAIRGSRSSSLACGCVRRQQSASDLRRAAARVGKHGKRQPRRGRIGEEEATQFTGTRTLPCRTEALSLLSTRIPHTSNKHVLKVWQVWCALVGSGLALARPREGPRWDLGAERLTPINRFGRPILGKPHLSRNPSLVDRFLGDFYHQKLTYVVPGESRVRQIPAINVQGTEIPNKTCRSRLCFLVGNLAGFCWTFRFALRRKLPSNWTA